MSNQTIILSLVAVLALAYLLAWVVMPALRGRKQRRERDSEVKQIADYLTAAMGLDIPFAYHGPFEAEVEAWLAGAVRALVLG